MNLPPMVRGLLWPVSVVYRGIVLLRAWLYSRGILKANRLKTPVISVGNLTTGGTGKTPMVIWLAERFLTEGKRVCVLSRGYKGSSGTSDEIQLMRHRLSQRVVFGVGPDRFEQGRRLEGNRVDVFLLDDGYQHLQLARDVNILLMDAVRPLGNEMLLPSGTLREPVSAMARADILVFTRTETSPNTDAAIEKLTDFPVFSAATRLLGFRRLGDIQMLTAEQIGAGPFYAFCGIGNPHAFFLDLKNWGITVAAKCEFADHHAYDDRDLRELESAARQAGAHVLVTTEKDAQNLAQLRLPEIPIYLAVIDLVISKEEAFLAAIRERLQARNAVA